MKDTAGAKLRDAGSQMHLNWRTVDPYQVDINFEET